MEVIKKLDMSDTEKLIFLSEEILPAMIWQEAESKDPAKTRVNAAAMAAAVTGNILQAVFERFDAEDGNEEVTAHGPRS